MTILWMMLWACQAAPAQNEPHPPPSTGQEAPEVRALSAPGAHAPAGTPIRQAFPPPAGFIRVPPSEFAQYAQSLPVSRHGTPLLAYDGRPIHGHTHRVLDVPMVPGDLQQCADAILRVRADWLRQAGGDVSFYSTSGEPMPWTRYLAGERGVADGNRLSWEKGHPPATWDEYLASVFDVAGTASLAERETLPASTPKPGDVVVEPGFPGHAVLIVDVATRGDDTVVLVIESFMPAQDVHVELGPVDGWWDWADGVALPHWPLERTMLRRWR